MIYGYYFTIFMLWVTVFCYLKFGIWIFYTSEKISMQYAQCTDPQCGCKGYLPLRPKRFLSCRLMNGITFFEVTALILFICLSIVKNNSFIIFLKYSKHIIWELFEFFKDNMNGKIVWKKSSQDILCEHYNGVHSLFYLNSFIVRKLAPLSENSNILSVMIFL